MFEEGLVKILGTQGNLLIVGGVWSLVQCLTKAFPGVAARAIVKRLKPMAGIVLCVGTCLIPGVQPDEMSVVNQVLVGLILGFGVGHGHKLLKRTAFGATDAAPEPDYDAVKVEDVDAETRKPAREKTLRMVTKTAQRWIT